MAYKNHTKLPVYSDCSLLTRTDIQHANEVSKLTSQVSQDTQHALGREYRKTGFTWIPLLSVLQVKYKENFDRHLKGQRPSYNPLDCLSFRHTQASGALASQVTPNTCCKRSCDLQHKEVTLSCFIPIFLALCESL